MLHVVRRDPRQWGIPQTRWTLDAIRRVVSWMERMTPSGIGRLLDRLRISSTRGREHVHSPDPDYLAKLAQIATLLGEVRESQGTHALLYLDEVTYYRQPSLSRAYEAVGRPTVLADRSYRSNTPTRVIGTIDACTGRVCAYQGSVIGVTQVVKFLRACGWPMPG